jgi:hypothetical protein
MDSAADTPRGVGCPIRKSSDQRSLPSPRSLSQGATSFIASRCQGIHQMPFLSLENVTRSAMRRDKPKSHTADPLMRNTTDVTSAKPDPSAPPPGGTPVARAGEGSEHLRHATDLSLAEANPRPRAGDQNLFTMSKTNFEGPKAFTDAGPARRTRGQAEPDAKPLLPSPQTEDRRLAGRSCQAASSKPGPLTSTPASAGPVTPAHRSRRGGAGRSRTDDLLRAKQALSQLSYGP